MNTIKKNQRGFSAIEALLILVIVGIIGFVGWYVHSAINSTDKNLSLTNGTAVAPKQKTPLPKTVTDFYSCVGSKGTLSKTGPVTCTWAGKVYTFSSTFSTGDITNYSKIPAAAQSVVIATAKQNFDGCVQQATSGSSGSVYPYVYVDIANTKFLDVGVSNCDSGYHEEYGLNGAAWADLGGGQGGISCDQLKQYGVTKSAIIDTTLVPSDCWTTNGEQQIPSHY